MAFLVVSQGSSSKQLLGSQAAVGIVAISGAQGVPEVWLGAGPPGGIAKNVKSNIIYFSQDIPYPMGQSKMTKCLLERPSRSWPRYIYIHVRRVG